WVPSIAISMAAPTWSRRRADTVDRTSRSSPARRCSRWPVSSPSPASTAPSPLTGERAGGGGGHGSGQGRGRRISTRSTTGRAAGRRDWRSGQTVAMLNFRTAVEEVFDVQLLRASVSPRWSGSRRRRYCCIRSSSLLLLLRLLRLLLPGSRHADLH